MSETDDDCEILMVKKGRPRIKYEEQLSKRRSAADLAQHKIRLTMMAQCENDSSSESESSEESLSDESFECESESGEENNELDIDENDENEPPTNLSDENLDQMPREIENNHIPPITSNVEPINSPDHQSVHQSKMEETTNEMPCSSTSFADIISQTEPIPNIENTYSTNSTNQPYSNCNQNPSSTRQIQNPLQSIENFISQHPYFTHSQNIPIQTQTHEKQSTMVQNSSYPPNPYQQFPNPIYRFYPVTQVYPPNQFPTLHQPRVSQVFAPNYSRSTVSNYQQPLRQQNIATSFSNQSLPSQTASSSKNPVPTISTCKKCQKSKEIFRESACFKCSLKIAIGGKYQAARKMELCNVCERLRKIYEKGACLKCYKKGIKVKKITKDHEAICVECNKLGVCGRGTTCRKCRKRKTNKQQRQRKRKRPLKICAECNKLKPHVGRGCCDCCYQKIFLLEKLLERRKTPEYKKSNLRMCIECGEVKRHEARGLCFHCAKRLIYNPNYQKACKERKEAKKLEKTKKSKERPLTSYFDSQVPTTSNNRRANLERNRK